MPALRRLISRHVLRCHGEVCDHCGWPVRIVWHAPDHVWLEAHGNVGGAMCTRCFADRTPGVWFVAQIGGEIGPLNAIVPLDHLARLVAMIEDAANVPRGDDGRDEEAIDNARAAIAAATPPEQHHDA